VDDKTRECGQRDHHRERPCDREGEHDSTEVTRKTSPQSDPNSRRLDTRRRGVHRVSSLVDRGRASGDRTVTGLFVLGFVCAGMDSVQKALRAGDIEKDTYERLLCAECGERLKTSNDPDEVGTVRLCPDCGREWREL